MNFIETIRIEGSEIELLELHQARIERTAHHFGFTPPILNIGELTGSCPHKSGRVKCRVLYSNVGIISIDYSLYTPRTIKNLKVVESDIEYSFKYENRDMLGNLLQLSDGHDDIIITRSDGTVTDSSYSNLLFERDGKLYTPRTPLLRGARRDYLLSRGIIVEADIDSSMIASFDTIHLINGMLNLGEVVVNIKRGVTL